MIESFAKKYIDDAAGKTCQMVPADDKGASPGKNYQIVPTDERSPSAAASDLGDAMVIGGDADADGDDDSDADDEVGRMEALALGTFRKRPAASLKRPASAVRITKAAPASGGSKVLKRPGSNGLKVFKRPGLKPPVGAKKLMLGCPRCRGGKAGCISCRSPAFTGRRFRSKGV